MLLLILTACDHDLPVAEPEVTPLEVASTPTLVQALYAGETLENPQGDRLRLMVWLASLEASPEELGALREAALRVAERRRSYHLERAALRSEEQAAYAAVYAELEGALVEGLDDEAAAGFAERMELVRASAPDGRALHMAYVEEVLGEARGVAAMLGPARAEAMANALFVLRSEVGEGVRPALYGELVGRPWSAGDFATLRRSELDEDAGQLDPGGLFTLDAGETRTTAGLDALRMQALLAMVLEDPELVPAIDRLTGRVEEARDTGP